MMQERSILLVEEDVEARLVLSEALSGKGYTLQSAASGSEALDRFQRENFGIVIAAAETPGISGLGLLTRLKASAPEVPVVLITARGSVEEAVAAMQEGASDYLMKPLLPATVDALIRRIESSGNGAPQSSREREPRRIVTRNPRFLQMLDLARSIASTRATVLIQGESGTGKEVLATFIHKSGGLTETPYIAVNCAALPDTLAESELFGHEKGAFTGAFIRKKGKFEIADRGTIVLDEISEMPLTLQAKLLRVIQEREIDRIGGQRPVPIDVRIIAISNIDLKKAVREGKFREDLFYRINVIPLTIPPLRERKEDIRPLAEYFLEKQGTLYRRTPKKFAEAALLAMENHYWKGNVRELENTVERAVLLVKGEVILPEELLFDAVEPIPPTTGGPSSGVGRSMKEMEQDLILRTLKEVKGNRTHAADILGVSIRTLRNKLREYRQECGITDI